jgi:predicted O-linked N-acetylglucosamine transferase (SPINDLY family)
LSTFSFYLAYHGENNRRLQEKLGRLIVQACPTLTWEAPHCRDYRRHTGRLRVGFASELFRNHSIGKTSSGLIAELDRERFEVFTLNLPGSSRADDATRQRLRQRTDHWLTLEGTLDQVRQSIADLRLDILFYQDIGMTPFSYFLAYSRLAPVQCVSFGHPDTTGIGNLDYFISNDLYETQGAADHYTERLFQLHNLPTLAYYYRPELPPEGLHRSMWGFKPTDHLYLCAQTLFKLHPEFDTLLSGILQRDPHAQIVLIDGNYKGWTRALQKRFAHTLGELARRVSFINRLDGPQFLALLRLADVALDTIHFNGMNSSLEAFAMGTPVVTLPTQLQRGRHTQAMYRQMELTACVARDLQDYVDIAVRIATEPDYRRALSQQILQHNAVLFENRRVLSEFERFFTTALP